MRWVVTGTNRGIGLEMVRQLAARGDDVVATARDTTAAHLLRELADAAFGKVHVVSATCGATPTWATSPARSATARSTSS